MMKPAKKYLWTGFYLIAVVGIVAGIWFQNRYSVRDVMKIPITEFSNSQYPEDPANRSTHYGRYSRRELQLVKKDSTHFDFIFDSTDSRTAKVVFKNIDVSLFVPIAPEWTKADRNLEKIAFVDREWNRQQVSFNPHSEHIEIHGGNGFEEANLYSAEIARNCLNAGLWEVLLFTQEDGQKALYYHGWFTFPLGHYKRVFEEQNKISYWRYWWSLEHWVDPVGTPVHLEALRKVVLEEEVETAFLGDEFIFTAGEQRRKNKTVEARNLVVWKDIFGEENIQFAAFIPPGRYSLENLRKNEYWRFGKLQKTILRNIHAPSSDKTLSEIELVFEVREPHHAVTRFIVSGIDLDAVPQLPNTDYPKGLYMPMGIGVPPFFQDYEYLQKNPSYKGPYFSVMLDDQGNWINHHDVAVDGPVIYKDKDDPNLLHILPLSYERHLLVGHFVMKLQKVQEVVAPPTPQATELPQKS